MTASHPELPNEQQYIDHAVDCLHSAQASARRMVDQDHSGSDRMAVRAIHEIGEKLLRRRHEAEDRICFGRTDAADGRTLYIGRELIHDSDNFRHPLVISWRADAAIPFYEA